MIHFIKCFSEIKINHVKRLIIDCLINSGLIHHTLITNSLNNRKQRVVVDDSFSNFADVESGVPQGTVLSPLLFLLHINDLQSCVNSKVRLFVQSWPDLNQAIKVTKSDFFDY